MGVLGGSHDHRVVSRPPEVVLEIVLQNPEHHIPAGVHAFILVIPLRTLAEPGFNQLQDGASSRLLDVHFEKSRRTARGSYGQN